MGPADLASRLRDALRRGGTAASPTRGTREGAATETARILEGSLVDTPSGPCLFIDRTCGATDLYDHAGGFGASVDRLDRLVAALTGAADATGPVLFVDVETTGLAGGAGTCAFLVGFGWLDDGGFRMRQLMLTGFEHERALLDAAGELIRGSGGLVSFNGRAFDIPLLETRYLFHRMAGPIAGRPHLDLLHPARRLWRQEAGCGLGVLERRLLAIRRWNDLPGGEIPSRFFEYVRTGDARRLVPVLEHNRLDLVSLAGLTLRLADLMDRGAEASHDAGECLGLGRLYERTGLVDRAHACYERAVVRALPAERDVRVEALRRLAALLRRRREHEGAARAWQTVWREAPADSSARRDALRGLAIHFEHRTGDLSRARALAAEAVTAERGEGLRDARRRVARLDRKLAFAVHEQSRPVSTPLIPNLLDSAGG